MRAPVLILLAAGTCLAQFQDLSTTDDGGVLFFSSSLRLRASSQELNSKLFALDARGPRLYDERLPGTPIGWTTTNFYRLVAPEVSADGRMVAYTAERPCYGGSGCLPVERYQGIVRGPGGAGERTFTGRITVSRNGRYAVAYGSTTFYPVVKPRWIDLESGEQVELAGAWREVCHRRIASDGTVLLLNEGRLVLWNKGGSRNLNNSRMPSSAMLSDDGARVVYESGGSLIAYDVKAGSETVLASGARPAISGDAGTVVFLNDGQAWLVHFDGGGLRRLTDEADRITEIALSGNSLVAYAVTGSGRLLQIDTEMTGVSERIGRTPAIGGIDEGSAIGSGGAPGTLMRIIGTGLSAETAIASAPLPDTLAGVEVTLDGKALPLWSVSPDDIRFQVPWTWPAGTYPISLRSGDSPFEDGPRPIEIAPVNPSFYSAASGGTLDILAVHEDWGSLVSAERPAQGGEVIHLYIGGLGAVDPPIVTGLISPAEPLSRVVAPPECRFWDGSPNESEMLFAGLAPGLIGIYQVSLRVPPGLRMSSPTLECRSADESRSAIGSLPVAL